MHKNFYQGFLINNYESIKKKVHYYSTFLINIKFTVSWVNWPIYYNSLQTRMYTNIRGALLWSLPRDITVILDQILPGNQNFCFEENIEIFEPVHRLTKILLIICLDHFVQPNLYIIHKLFTLQKGVT